MKKYIYKFCVYKNNMRDGVQFVKAFDSLSGALSYKEYQQFYAGGGCCDVVKKRFLPGENRPEIMSIYNNYKYTEYDI